MMTKDPLFEKTTYAGLITSVRQRIPPVKDKNKRVRFIGSGFAYRGDSSKLEEALCVNKVSHYLLAGVPRYR